ncbi:MAG: inositol monophosphatase [Bacteroidales bacterium]|nr:inositol monophosphatase [Bacteroidales bacterium]
MSINLESINSSVIQVCREAGEFIQSQRQQFEKSKIETKGLHDYVSYVDKTSEKMIVEKLKHCIPNAGFIAEEGTSNHISEDYNWIIDPLDGTTNFIHGLAPYCISIGLSYRNQMILGVIFEPNLNEMFTAIRGKGAYLNGKPIYVSDTPDLDNSLLATGFPYYDYHRLDEYMELFKWCMKNTRGVRRLGSAAIDLAYVACGRMEGFFEYGLKPWDVAAGALIVEEAGGKVSDFQGNDNYLFGKEILAFNKKTYHDFLKTMQLYFKNHN